MKNKSKLRQEYERLLGKEISDRTWQRLRLNYLGIDNEYCLDDHLSVIQGAALLRRCRPSDPVTRESAERFGLVIAHFDSIQQMTGRELRAALLKCFKNTPCPRWFRNRGIYAMQMVSRDKIFEVLAAIVNKRQFQAVRDDVPRVKSLVERVTDEFTYKAS